MMNKNNERKLKSIGKAIRIYRKAKKLRQEDVAARMELSHKYVSSIERGVDHPSDRNIAKFGLAMGVSPGDILNTATRLELACNKNSLLPNDVLEAIAQIKGYQSLDSYLTTILASPK